MPKNITEQRRVDSYILAQIEEFLRHDPVFAAMMLNAMEKSPGHHDKDSIREFVDRATQKIL